MMSVPREADYRLLSYQLIYAPKCLSIDSDSDSHRTSFPRIFLTQGNPGLVMTVLSDFAIRLRRRVRYEGAVHVTRPLS